CRRRWPRASSPRWPGSSTRRRPPRSRRRGRGPPPLRRRGGRQRTRTFEQLHLSPQLGVPSPSFLALPAQRLFRTAPLPPQAPRLGLSGLDWLTDLRTAPGTHLDAASLLASPVMVL